MPPGFTFYGTAAKYLAGSDGTNHDAVSRVGTTELQQEFVMTEPTATVEQPHEINPPIDRGMSIGKAAIITIVSVLVVFVSTYEVIKATLSTGMTRILAVVSLLSVVAAAYGLIELALAVIATTAERRRKAREVTERRKGDRARRPTPR